MSDEESNLPAVSIVEELGVEIKSPIPIKANTSLDEIREVEIQSCNMQAEILCAAWEHARTLPAVLALMKETREQQKHVRNILGFSYGPDAVKSNGEARRSQFFEPLP